MNRLLILILCFASSSFAASTSPAVPASAGAPVSLQFRSVGVVQFLHTVYSSILRRDFVLSDSVLQVNQVVSVNVGSIKPDAVPALVQRVIASVGIEGKEVGGLLYFDIIKPPPASVSAPVAPAVVGPVLPSISLPAPALLPGAAASAPDIGADLEIGFEVYKPRYRTATYLAKAAKLGPQEDQDVVLVSGAEKRRKVLLQLLATLDAPAPAVEVKAVLVEVQVTDDQRLDLGGILELFSGKLKLSLGASSISGNTARLQVGGLSAILGAMAGDSRFRFRSQPSLRLLDGTTGKLQVGTDTPVRGQLTTTKDGAVLQSIEYRSSGLLLSVIPRVLGERIQALVRQEVSTFARTQTSGIDSPTLNKRSVEASVDVASGEVIVLAGLDEETSSDSRSGLPGFRYLGNLKSTSNTRIVVLLEFTRAEASKAPEAALERSSS